jgi:putative FmdB family regulatory protein
MPTYEYECKKCGHCFEAVQSINDEPLKKCPKCGKGVRRLIFGGAGVIFKGSGFYVTDKNKGSQTRVSAGSASKEGKKPEETVTGDAVKSDAKPDGGAATASKEAGSSTEKKSVTDTKSKTAAQTA